MHTSLTFFPSSHKQETVRAAIIEEQKRSEKAVEEAVKRTRDELIEYVKEQKRVSIPPEGFYFLPNSQLP